MRPGDHLNAGHGHPLRVLLVHDSIEKSLLIERQLRACGYGIEVRRVASAVEMRSALQEQAFDIILSSHLMEGFGALDALAILGRSGLDVPFVVVAGSIGEEAVAALMRLGANDFVREDHLAFLGGVVDRQLKECADRMSRRQAEEALALASEHLLRETRTQARTFRALHEVAVAASGVLEPEALARLAVEHAGALLNVDGVVVYGWDEAARVLRPLYETRSPAEEPVVVSGEGAIGMAFESCKAIIIEDYQSWEHRVTQSASRGMVSALAVPLVTGDRAIGSLGVWTYQQRQFTPEEVELLTLFAAQIAPELEAARLHADLAASEERFRTLHASMACGVIVQNPDGEIIEANEAALDLLDLRREEVIGSYALAEAAMYREDGVELKPEERPTAAVLRRREAVRNFPLCLARPGRPDVWLQVDAVPVLTRDGELKQVVTSFIDITQRRQAEEARRENEAKSRFLATMSHELRTPLNSVLGFAQLLANPDFGELNERQRRYLGHIESSGRHLLSLINDVLDLSKVVAGQMTVEITDVDARELIESCAAHVRPLVEAKALHLELALDHDPVVRADRRRLQQVVLNLLSNAIKFTPPQGRITISSSLRDTEVDICFSDTGPGIPAEEQERIFEEFTQIDSGPARNQEGTGLGLALSRHLMELMAGSLTLQSQVGRGSTFRTTLPRSQRSSLPAEVVAQEKVGAGPTRA